MTGQTSDNRDTGVTDIGREGKTGIDLEWLAPLKIMSTFIELSPGALAELIRREGEAGAGQTVFVSVAL